MLSFIRDNVKNLGGWRTSRKLVVINVDDYGNVRVSSKAALENLKAAGLDMSSRMDRLDTLETTTDLHLLFDVLDSVRDKNGNPAKFTAYTLSANPDFHRIQTERTYCYERLPETFQKLASAQPAAYEGAWEAWNDGISRRLIKPQFHGREHLNLTLLTYKLENHIPDLQSNLDNHSMAGMKSELSGIGFTQAFAISTSKTLEEQITVHRNVIADGMDLFERVFGFRSATFTPPSQVIHPSLYSTAEETGLKAIDKPYRVIRDLGDGRRRIERNRLGRQDSQKHITITRNVVFEPSEDQDYDPVRRALELMKTAFRWGKPAIISSHRVNFCGHIDPAYRTKGLSNLKRLLDSALKLWPDIEFVFADELVTVIQESIK